MSVQSYLLTLASDLSVKDRDRDRIDTSIGYIKQNLRICFSDLKDIVVFGSYDRRTSLRKYYDAESDVDLMVVFEGGGQVSPQHLLNRLKRFAEHYYPRSIVNQSNPTIVIQLDHIKFELVPAYKTWHGYFIPAPSRDYQDWLQTNPSLDKDKVNEANSRNNGMVKRVSRILKYWNVLAEKPFSSYELEMQIAGFSYMNCNGLKDYFYYAIRFLNGNSVSSSKQYKVEQLKTKADEALDLEIYEHDHSGAERVIRGLF